MRALKLLNTLFSPTVLPDEKKRILSKKYNIVMTVELESEVQRMCNLGTAIENKGIETGIEIGEKKKAKELAIKLYKKGSSLETISELIEVPVSQLEEWLELQAV